MKRTETKRVRWTNEEVAQLKELVISGATANQISRRMGRTRNAVVTKKSELGIAHRLRDSRRPKARLTSARIENTMMTAMMDLMRSMGEFKERTGLEVTFQISRAS